MALLKLVWITSFLLTWTQGILKLPNLWNGSSTVFATADLPLETQAKTSSNSSSVLQAESGLSEFATLTSEAWTRTIAWRKTVEHSFCKAKSSEEILPPAVVPISTEKATTTPQEENTEALEVSLPYRLLQSVGTVLNVTEEAQAEEVEEVETLPLVRVTATEVANDSGDSTSEPEYKISVNYHVIGRVFQKDKADRIAQRLQQALAQENFDPTQIHPTAVDGKFGGVIGETVLFTIDEVVKKASQTDSQLLAIKWVNNLRVALHTPPLKLAEAQLLMFDLEETSQEFQGLASWYGPYFHGRLTANGETYNQFAMTAAHPSLPLNTFLKVTNLENQNTIIVRVNDRGPYIPPRSLDVSLGVARCIGSEEEGVVRYKAVIMKPSEIVTEEGV